MVESITFIAGLFVGMVFMAWVFMAWVGEDCDAD